MNLKCIIILDGDIVLRIMKPNISCVKIMIMAL